MPSFYAWLDDIRHQDSFELKRIALSMATVIWLAFAVLDLMLVQAPQLGWMLAVRLGSGDCR